MFKALTFGIVLIAAPAQAAPYELRPVAEEGQTIRYVQGVGVLESPLGDVMVRIAPLKPAFDGNERAAFVVIVFNNSQTAFDLDPNSIAATSNGRSWRRFSAGELIGEIERRANTQNALSAFFYGFSSGLANGQTTITTNGTMMSTGSLNFSNGRLPYQQFSQGQSISTIIDPTAQLQAQMSLDAQQRADRSDTESRLQTSLNAVQSLVLQRTTVDPGAMAGGEVYFGNPIFSRGRSSLNIVITVRGEPHIYKFEGLSGRLMGTQSTSSVPANVVDLEQTPPPSTGATCSLTSQTFAGSNSACGYTCPGSPTPLTIPRKSTCAPTVAH
ncbi:MAG: hypothetical protein SGJ21_07025 [Alphaproteobacteria bacterium]|nr:hypothetical protein [Alphaproteobacteria bacterium]